MPTAKRKTKRRAPARPKPTRAKRRKPPEPEVPDADEPDAIVLAIPETETVEEAITAIAQDAVVILRRELAYKAEVALRKPGEMKMRDITALLSLSADLGERALRGKDGEGQRVDYSRLTPEERVQLAGLLLKVDYA